MSVPSVNIYKAFQFVDQNISDQNYVRSVALTAVGGTIGAILGAGLLSIPAAVAGGSLGAVVAEGLNARGLRDNKISLNNIDAAIALANADQINPILGISVDDLNALRGAYNNAHGDDKNFTLDELRGEVGEF